MKRGCPPKQCLYKYIRCTCVNDWLLQDSDLNTPRLRLTWLPFSYSRSVNANMAFTSQTKTQIKADTTHEKDDDGNCAHVEHSDEQGRMANGDPEAGRRNLDQAEKKLVRKLDWVILPVLWIMYWFK